MFVHERAAHSDMPYVHNPRWVMRIYNLGKHTALAISRRNNPSANSGTAARNVRYTHSQNQGSTTRNLCICLKIYTHLINIELLIEDISVTIIHRYNKQASATQMSLLFAPRYILLRISCVNLRIFDASILYI